MRYFINCSYLGTNYVGWQRQPNGESVQGVIEQAFATMLREKIEIVGCGRTDAGVHASNYIFHVDVQEQLAEGFLRKMNRFLPGDIAFNSIQSVSDEMHARYSAKERSYEYYLSLAKDPFRQQTAYYFPYPDHPDFDVMNQVGEMLMRYNDFSTFCKTGTDTPHFLCDLTYARWHVDGDSATFRITANRFLRGMVRLIVGAMLRTGRGASSFEEIEQAMKAQRPLAKSESAPGHGLHLVEIKY
jgi:tRNA pseudouridine38-40 synthase